MEVTGGNIVLIVGGKLIRDDANIIGGILQKVEDFMADVDQLSQTISDLNTHLSTLIADVTAMLSQPQPNVPAAIAALQQMQTAVDTADQEVQAAMNPQPPPAP